MSTPTTEENKERYFKYKGPGIIAGLPINPSDQETYYHTLTMIKFFGFNEKDMESWLNAGLFIEVSEKQMTDALANEEIKKKSRATKLVEVTGETSRLVPINSQELGDNK